MGIHYNIIPVTTGDFTHTLHKYDVLPEYTKNTRSYTMTYTGHDRRLYNWYRSLPTTLYTFYTIMCESSEYTKNTRSCIMTWTGHDRRLYNQYRSLPTTLYTSHTIMCESSEYTKNTRSCTMTGTGHDRRLYNQYRSLPTTLYTFYTIMCESSEYTKNTRSCTMTWTGHDRWLYKCLALLLGLRSTGVGIWYDDHGCALPTVRIIVPSSRMVSVRPNTIS